MKPAIYFACFFASLLVSTMLQADHIDRRIEREPVYKSKPLYLLLAFGSHAQSFVWVVLDGDRLYVDKNGNRDLTDDGMPVSASKKRSLDASRWDRHFDVEAWKSSDGINVSEFKLNQWNYADPHDNFGLSLTLDNTIPMYAGWIALFKDLPADAKVVYFGGPVAPRSLRYDEFVLGKKESRFSIAFMTPRELITPSGSKIAPAYLSIESMSESVKPKAVIDWPVAADSPALQTTHELPKRCCYWEFYTESFEIPDRAIAGTAKVKILIPMDKPAANASGDLTERKTFPLEMIRDQFEMPVVRKK